MSQMRMVYPFPGGRRRQNERKVTFKRNEELKLPDTIFDKGTPKVTPCLFEMSLVFACLKDNNFNDQHCLDEVKKLHTCYVNSIEDEKKLKQRMKNPGIMYGTENLIPAEKNMILKKYKQ